MKTYEVTLHRIVEHETVYRVKANSEEEATDFVLGGEYEEVVQDSEEGETENPEIVEVTKV